MSKTAAKYDVPVIPEDRFYELDELCKLLRDAHKVFFDSLSANLEHVEVTGLELYEYGDAMLRAHETGLIKLKKKDAARLREDSKPTQESLRRMIRCAWVRPFYA